MQTNVNVPLQKVTSKKNLFSVGILSDNDEKSRNRFRIRKSVVRSVSVPYSFFTDPDPDPVDPDGGQYGSGYGSGSNTDPGL
jgi:hypothetical protein